MGFCLAFYNHSKAKILLFLSSVFYFLSFFIARFSVKVVEVAAWGWAATLHGLPLPPSSRCHPKSSMQLVHLVLRRPTGLLPFALAGKTCSRSLSWGILLTWPNHLSQDFSIQRSNGPMLRDFRMSELRTLLNSVTLSILCKTSLRKLALVVALFRPLSKIDDHRLEWGQKLFWKLRV